MCLTSIEKKVFSRMDRETGYYDPETICSICCEEDNSVSFIPGLEIHICNSPKCTGPEIDKLEDKINTDGDPTGQLREIINELENL